MCALASSKAWGASGYSWSSWATPFFRRTCASSPFIVTSRGALVACLAVPPCEPRAAPSVAGCANANSRDGSPCAAVPRFAPRWDSRTSTQRASLLLVWCCTRSSAYASGPTREVHLLANESAPASRRREGTHVFNRRLKTHEHRYNDADSVIPHVRCSSHHFDAMGQTTIIDTTTCHRGQ